MKNPFRYFKTSPEIIRLAVMSPRKQDIVRGFLNGADTDASR